MRVSQWVFARARRVILWKVQPVQKKAQHFFMGVCTDAACIQSEPMNKRYSVHRLRDKSLNDRSKKWFFGQFWLFFQYMAEKSQLLIYYYISIVDRF